MALASLPEGIAGYGHVKERRMREVARARETHLARYRAGAGLSEQSGEEFGGG